MPQLTRKIRASFDQAARHFYGTIPLSLRYGPVFRETRRLLRQSQRWSRDELDNYQWRQIKSLLERAHTYVPYYRTLLARTGLTPEDLRAPDDWRTLPFLDKETVRQNLTDFLADDIPESDLAPCSTGGSTGSPLRFYCTRRVSVEREWAFIFSQWERVGFRVGEPTIVLRGQILEDERLSCYDSLHRALVLSSYRLNRHTLPRYLSEMQGFNARFIHAYPSSIALLGYLMKQAGNRMSGLKAILCGSEPVHPWQRSLLEEVFACRVYTWYGHSEQGALAGECEVSPLYHEFPEYGLLEIIDPEGKAITHPGEVGEIVTTGFNNPALPLIRYRTGDYACWSAESCPCGRQYRLLEQIQGRQQEFFVTLDNQPVPFIGSFNWAKGLDTRIASLQFHQKEKGKVVVRIATSAEHRLEEEKALLAVLAKRYGQRLDFYIEHTERFTLTAQGKQPIFIQEMNSPFAP